MIRKSFLPVTALTLLLAAAPAFGSILWFTDGNQGFNVIPGAITLAGKTGVQALNLTDFNTQLTAGGWEVVIVGEQSGDVFLDATTATNLTSWVTGGGRLIGATWRSAGFAALLEGTVVDSNGLTITTVAHPIFSGLGATIDLTDPGWATYSHSYDAVGGGVGLGTLGATGSAVILGNSGRTLLNGPLFDSYLSTAEGEQFVANEIGFLLADVPEPGTWAMLLGGLTGLVALRRRRQ